MKKVPKPLKESFKQTSLGRVMTSNLSQGVIKQFREQTFHTKDYLKTILTSLPSVILRCWYHSTISPLIVTHINISDFPYDFEELFLDGNRTT